MSFYDCYSCKLCNGKCDRCISVCSNNVRDHEEIYKLKEAFYNLVDKAWQNTYDKCLEIKNKLLNDYGINIEISQVYDKLEISKDFFRKIVVEKENIQNELNQLKNKIEIKKKEQLDKINKLNEEHINNKKSLVEKFNKEKELYKIDESKYEEAFKSRKQVINDLMNEKDNIFIDIEGIVKSFVDEERKKVEKEFNENKVELDEKYSYTEKEFKYSQEELEKKNEYLDGIRKIKSYSEKIPNFENWINAFNLNKYLN